MLYCALQELDFGQEVLEACIRGRTPKEVLLQVAVAAARLRGLDVDGWAEPILVDASLE